MIFKNAPQAIHDAYCIDLTSPDPVSMSSGTKFDSTAKNFRNVLAGKVIAAVEKMDPHLKAIAIYVHGPEEYFITERMIESLWEKLQEDFWSRNIKRQFSPKQRSKVPSLARRAILNYKKMQNSRVDLYSQQELVASMGRVTIESFVNAYQRDWVMMEGILSRFMRKALNPVNKIVKSHKETVNDRKVEELELRLKKNNVAHETCIGFINLIAGSAHEAINSFTWADADLAENELDMIEFKKGDRLAFNIKLGNF